MIAGSWDIYWGFVLFHMQSIGNVFPSSTGSGTNRQMADDGDR